MQVQHLRSFVVAAECRSYSAAARRMSYSESSIVYHVRTLEKSLGAPLLLRVDNRLEMTDVGIAVLGPARDLLAAANRLAAAAKAGTTTSGAVPRPRAPSAVTNGPPQRRLPDPRAVAVSDQHA